MGHDLYARNEVLRHFHFGGGWSLLLAQSGAYFPCMIGGIGWRMLHDGRMTTHNHYPEGDEEGERRLVIDKNYPAIICNCGFEVTEEEANVLARIARNYAAIQRTLPDQTDEEIFSPEHKRLWPLKMSAYLIEKFEQFADWAEQSQGFYVH